MTYPPRAAARLIADQRAHQPDVVRLARLLCLAAQAEAFFVREARLRFLPHSSTGLEARLWFSPLVEAADGRTLVLDAAVASALRGELAGDRALLDSVRDFTAHAHRDAPLAVRVFESLLWAATAGEGPAEDRVRRALAPFLARVLAGGAEALEASRWALRYLPRLPAAVGESAPARRLRIIAAERLGLDLEPAAGDADAREARAARRLVHDEVDIGVRAVPGGVVLTRPPERDALVCQVSGAARVRLRVRVALPGAGWHDLDLHERRRADVPLDVLATVRLDGTVEAARAEPGESVRCAWSGGRGVVAVTAGRRTLLRCDAPGRVLSAELAAPPELLAVADTGAPRAAAVAGTTLSVVRTALDGSGEVTAHTWSPAPAAVGWIERSVLCVAEGRRVHLLADGDPGHVLRQLGHDAAVVRMWTSAALGAVAVADADGRVVLHRAAASGDTGPRVLAGPGERVTALTGDAATGALAWATRDGRVHVLASPHAHTPVVRGRAPAAPTCLALLPDLTVIAADASGRLRRFSPQDTTPAGTSVRVGFGVRNVYAVGDGERLVLAGDGAPVEIRSEDGRTHVVVPGVAAGPAVTAGPAWPHASVGVVLPAHDAPSPDAPWLRAARRAGVGHVCVGGPLLDDVPGLAALVEDARGAGLRVVAVLRWRAPDGSSEAATTSGSGAELLLAARRLLDAGLDGLRVVCPADGAGAVRGTLEDLRHLVDAYPGAALIAVGGPAGAAHLTLGPPPDPAAAPEDPAARGARWALPDGCPPLDARRLLALPGCCEAPYALLAAADRESAGLRELLGVRARQLALVRGNAEPVTPAPPAAVSAVWRRCAGQSVLCLVNASAAPVTVRVDAAADERRLIDLIPYDPPAADPGGPAPVRDSPAGAGRSGAATGAGASDGDTVMDTPPLAVHAAGGRFTVAVGAGRARWLSVWDASRDAVRSS